MVYQMRLGFVGKKNLKKGKKNPPVLNLPGPGDFYLVSLLRGQK